jgi:hypothetical protein
MKRKRKAVASPEASSESNPVTKRSGTVVNQEQAAQDQGKEEKLRAWKKTLENRTFNSLVAFPYVSTTNNQKPSSSSLLQCPGNLSANTFPRQIDPTQDICLHGTLKDYIPQHSMEVLGAPHRCYLDFQMCNAGRKIAEAALLL